MVLDMQFADGTHLWVRVGAGYVGYLMRPVHTHGSAHRVDPAAQPFRLAG